MLTLEENELMTRVGPGTPMGTYLRQYWLPSTVASTMLPSPDCSPIRVRLLGENLVAFRTTSGDVGLIQNACPHRGASMFFGRNEEEGLRCVYHGWKFDVDGKCVDMPSEPAESNFKSKVHAVAYPCREVNGMIWTYMGAREVPPPFPELEFNTVAPEMCYHPQFVFYDCNWVQALEGDIDSSHINYLHSRLNLEPVQVIETGGDGHFLPDRTPNLLPRPMDYGAIYAAQRKWDDEGNYYYRISQFCLPFFTLVGGNTNPETVGFQAWIPLDDEHTLQISMRNNLTQPLPAEMRAPRDIYKRLGGYAPATSDPLTRWRSPANRSNDYLLDYENQKTQMFCGVPREGKLQDIAMMEGMGAVYDRPKEHLGRSDAMIILVRRTLISAAKQLRDDGIVHATVDDPSLYHVRSAAAVLPEGVDWFEATAEQRKSDSGLELAYVVETYGGQSYRGPAAGVPGYGIRVV